MHFSFFGIFVKKWNSIFGRKTTKNDNDHSPFSAPKTASSLMAWPDWPWPLRIYTDPRHYTQVHIVLFYLSLTVCLHVCVMCVCREATRTTTICILIFLSLDFSPILIRKLMYIRVNNNGEIYSTLPETTSTINFTVIWISGSYLFCFLIIGNVSSTKRNVNCLEMRRLFLPFL